MSICWVELNYIKLEFRIRIKIITHPSTCTVFNLVDPASSQMIVSSVHAVLTAH